MPGLKPLPSLVDEAIVKPGTYILFILWLMETF